MASYEDLVNRMGADQPTFSRREMLKQGAAAVVGGGAGALIGQPPLLAQGPQNAAATAAAEAERQAPGKTTGLKTRALVRYADKLETETLTLLPLHPQHVVIRNQAAQCCYSTTNVLNTTTPAMNATVAGHGGVGIVEEVGSAVKRVRVGDQVIIAITTHCGACSNCLNGRGDLCYQLATRPRLPSATMSDGTPVDIAFLPSAYSEYVVTWEDFLVPVFTKVPPAEMAVLACVGATGLGLAMNRYPIEAGTEVAVFGLGPIGVSAVQGARIQGAKTIIGIDPIRYRRELALKLGATHVLDPNALRGNDLINRIRELTPDVAPAGRRYLGEHVAGPLYVIEAAGGTRFPVGVGVESPPDMTGVEPLQQAWTVARSAGYVRTCSIGHPMGASVSFPAAQWSNAGKTHVPGNYAGVQALRDLPKFVRLIEQGLYDAKSMVGRVFTTNQMREAQQAAADRTWITAVIDFT
ncbi:MAG: alcohol dehydrogenase catalytic domain-containing protein [Vicinamibacterales bacterium]